MHIYHEYLLKKLLETFRLLMNLHVSNNTLSMIRKPKLN